MIVLKPTMVYDKMKKMFDDHDAIFVVDSAFNMQNKDYL